MAQVHRLTAKNCLYYQRGHCTKPQNVQPPEEGTCLLIVERKKIGRQALDRLKRLERFDLSRPGSDRLIAEKYIVDRNLKEMAKVQCKNFIDSGVKFPPLPAPGQHRMHPEDEALSGTMSGLRDKAQGPMITSQKVHHP